MLKKIANPNIKSILKCFDINDYRKRGGGETKDRIYRIDPLNNRRDEMKNAIKAISRNGEKPDNTKSMDTHDLIDLLMFKINKMMPRKCEECSEYYNDQINPLKWPRIECDTCYVSAHMCLQSSSTFVPFIYEDKESLIKMIGLKWRCFECNDSIEKNKLSDLLKDKIMKESIKKSKMLRKEKRAKDSPETRKTSKTPNPPKTISLNDNNKTQSHKPCSGIVDLGVENMDIEDANGPPTVNEKTTPPESRIGIDTAGVESLRPRKWVTDDVLEFSVAKVEKEISTQIGGDNNKIGIVGPAVSELILRGEDPKNPDFLRKTCRNLLEGTINKQDNTIFFINYNKM